MASTLAVRARQASTQKAVASRSSPAQNLKYKCKTGSHPNSGAKLAHAPWKGNVYSPMVGYAITGDRRGRMRARTRSEKAFGPFTGAHNENTRRRGPASGSHSWT
ncbi:protein of unknown function (plasmid) [Nitratireductor aquimarinus]